MSRAATWLFPAHRRNNSLSGQPTEREGRWPCCGFVRSCRPSGVYSWPSHPPTNRPPAHSRSPSIPGVRQQSPPTITPSRVLTVYSLAGQSRSCDENGERQMNHLLTKADIARMLAVSPRTVDRLRRSNDLRAIRVRGRVRFRPEDLAAYIDAQKAIPGP